MLGALKANLLNIAFIRLKIIAVYNKTRKY